MTTPDSPSPSSAWHRADFATWRSRLTAPRTRLAGVVIAAVALALSPPSLTEPLRHGWQFCCDHHKPPWAALWTPAITRSPGCGLSASADRLSAAESEAARLTEQNRQLEAELELIRGDATTLTTAVGTGDSLLISDTVTARVLGTQAQAYLKSRDLLDAGSRADAPVRS